MSDRDRGRTQSHDRAAGEAGYMIIVGRGADRLLRERSTERTLTFETLRELDLWRHEQSASPAAPTIEVDVMAALREVAQPRTDLQGEVLLFIEALCEQRSVPVRVEDVVPAERSRSSFYRAWRETMPEAPKQFLERVRLIHARRLIEQQAMSRKEVAFRSGYASSWHMGQAILRRAEKNAGIEAT